MELTAQQAQEELELLSTGDLRELARQMQMNIEGKGREDLVLMLLGRCAKCNSHKDNMKVTYIHKVHENKIISQEAPPCVGCGK